MSVHRLTRIDVPGNAVCIRGHDRQGVVVFEWRCTPEHYREEFIRTLQGMLDAVDPPVPALSIEPGAAPRVSRWAREQNPSRSRAAATLRVVR